MIFHSWKMHKKNTTILLKRFVNEGIEVLYLEKLAAESLTTPEIREQFIEEYLDEANIRGRQTKNAIREILRRY